MEAELTVDKEDHRRYMQERGFACLVAIYFIKGCKTASETGTVIHQAVKQTVH